MPETEPQDVIEAWWHKHFDASVGTYGDAYVSMRDAKNALIALVGDGEATPLATVITWWQTTSALLQAQVDPAFQAIAEKVSLLIAELTPE